MFTAYLKKTISIRDTGVPLAKKENFYHGILLGLFTYMEEWNVLKYGIACYKKRCKVILG